MLLAALRDPLRTILVTSDDLGLAVCTVLCQKYPNTTVKPVTGNCYGPVDPKVGTYVPRCWLSAFCGMNSKKDMLKRAEMYVAGRNARPRKKIVLMAELSICAACAIFADSEELCCVLI